MFKLATLLSICCPATSSPIYGEQHRSTWSSFTDSRIPSRASVGKIFEHEQLDC